MTKKFSDLNFAEKLLVAGNIIGSIGTLVVFVGSILRKSELPDSPMFNNGVNDVSSPRVVSRNSNQSNYWEK